MPYVNVVQQKGLHRILFFKVHPSLPLSHKHPRVIARSYLFFFFSLSLSLSVQENLLPQTNRERLLFLFGDHFSIYQYLSSRKRASVIFTRTSTPMCPHSCGHYINICPTVSLRVVRDLISYTVHIDSSSTNSKCLNNIENAQRE